MAQVTIFTSPTCTYCKAAKKYMTEKDIPFEEIDITEDKEARKDLLSKGYTGVPIIRVDGEDIVGFDQQKLNEKLGL